MGNTQESSLDDV